MEEEKFYTIILRHDDSTKWMINDPILALGEYGVEDDTHRIKRGNGNSKWSELQYEHFGLEYLITFNNLRGEVSDNIPLQNALDAKVDKKIFEDINNTVISGLLITTEEGKIGKITKTTKDVVNGTVKVSQLLIQSDDESIQGVWSIDAEGTEILNLRANAAIDDYEPKRKYAKDHICFYDNILYRAVEDFEAGVVFEPTKWVKLASLHSDDIKYDNKISGLESKTVKKALDELADLDSQKVEQTRRPFKVYGTNEDGEQMLYDKDSLRTVDSVNGIEADPETKNIQIDAKGINYDDAEQIKRSIKEVLDSKVDKVVAGEGAKIVRDVTVAYNEETGKITLTEDKVSLEDGSSETQTSEVDVASNTELQNARDTLDTRITDEVAVLNTRIDDEVQSLTDTIDKNDVAINERVDNEVATLNSIIEANKTDIEGKLEDAETRLQSNIDRNDQRVTDEVATLNDRIDTEVATLNNTIDANKTDIETKLANEVRTLDQTIDTNETEINARVDREVADLNKTITDNKIEINDKVDANKVDIEDKLTKGLNTKIDKDIADSIIVGIGVSTEVGEKLDEPTLKIVAKNTDTKTEVVKHIHFAEKGVINVTKENDHIVIDSSEIDLQVKNNKEAIEANDIEINALQEHDVVHDTELALHASQIANHETRMLEAEADIVRIDKDIADLDDKIEAEITDRKVADAALENDISRNALNIQTNKEDIRANADNIVELNNILQENVTNLANSKLDKDFAAAAQNKITANIDLMEVNNNLADAKLIGIDVLSKQIVTKNYILKSSDNTLVSKAIKDANGDIIGYDLATNLDTDVNYWITTEILSTTIPSETVLDMTKLTSTTKSPIELQDIVSDAEGTWARVQEIDNEANTVTVVTFHKHAQAVWGTVKGILSEQTDLQEALDNKIDESIASNLVTGIRISDSGSNRENLDNIKFNWDYKPTTGSGGYTAQGGVFAKSDSILLTKGQGTNPTTYRFKVEAEGVEFKPEESGLTSTLLAPAIRELKTLDDAKVTTVAFDEYKTEAADLYIAKDQIGNHNNGGGQNRSVIDLFNIRNNDVAGFTFHRALIEGERADSGYYFNYIIDAPDSDISFKYEDKGSTGAGYAAMYHHMKVEAENILIDTTDTTLTETKLAPIVRELSNKIDAGVQTVNGVGIDENQNIQITGEDILETTAEDAETLAIVLDNIKSVFAEMNAEYVPGKDYYTTSVLGTINFVHYTHKASGVTLMGKVMQDFTADTVGATVYESFKTDVMNGNISLVGIPEQIEEDDTNTITGIIPGALIGGLWMDETSTAEFEARDGEGNIIASRTLKASDVTPITFADMECGQFELNLAEGKTADDAKDLIYDLQISATFEGETMSQTFQFAYDIDNDIYFADRWPA